MKVTLRTEGGLAYFPGMTKSHVLDSTSLSPQEVKELQRLLDKVRVFDHSRPSKHTCRGADQMHYMLTVDDGANHYSLQVCDPVQDPQIKALLSFVKDRLRVKRE
ncbi:conserved hypothetical protein [Ktedonobacter racemifer DSM 44963]|jgi:hypothetical protein|uniref:Uncharacterized protein n=1 Tax=Ktedonobacter racemifer DSM 44963 TaxID=485913 RepID=D6TYJ2_KTERA|nr:conserved hypothetical protein [Ktedonobacter racemifer DSM 44963]GHO70279.1 hypothetical protein KSC_091710 [Ktedonobacter sp. SOSP1-52]